MGHEKAPPFPDWRNLLHGVCWCILCISLVFSQVASQWFIVQLREWKTSRVEAEKRKNDSQVAAVMMLSIVVFITGLLLIFCTWSRSSFNQDYYMWAFFIFVVLVLARRALWCFWRICKSDNIDDLYKLSLTNGHESDPSRNVFSFFTLYPAIFMACHHLLWILLGVITEPFWGVSVLVAVISVSAILVFFFYDFYEYYFSHERSDHENECSARRDWRCEDWFSFFMSLFLVLGSCAAFVLLIIVLLVVAQSFLSESLVSTLVQNGLVFFSTLWLGYLKLHHAKKPAETRNGGNAGNSNQSGQPNDYELVDIQVQQRP